MDQMIYHKNLQRVAYVFAETAGRPPADVVVDVLADQAKRLAADRADRAASATAGWPRQLPARSRERTFLSNGSGIAWGVPAGFTVDFAGEGEWKITLDVFRDLGLAFGAAMIGIYVLLVAQTRLVRHSRGRHAGHPADDPGRDAGLLAAECAQRPAGGRLPRSGLLHGHGHDRHDRPGGHRDPRLDHPGRLHPPVAGPRPLAVRRDHGEPGGALAADPADRHAPPCSARCRSSSTRSSPAWPGR